MEKKTSKRKARSLDEEAARERCLRLLSVRARSAAELRERLLQSGFPRGAVQQALAGLQRAGLVDDREFARSWVVARSAAGIGRLRLRVELARKGVARETIEQVIGERVDDAVERDQLERLARKRLERGERDARTLGRVRRFLLGRGYESGLVDEVLRSIAADVEV